MAPRRPHANGEVGDAATIDGELVVNGSNLSAPNATAVVKAIQFGSKGNSATVDYGTSGAPMILVATKDPANGTDVAPTGSIWINSTSGFVFSNIKKNDGGHQWKQF